MGTLNSLEKQVLQILLAGEDEALSILRQQAAVATVSSREMTGVGFFTHFALPADAAPILGAPNLQLTDVNLTASNLENGAGFVLFIKDGVLDFLEGFTYTEPWPDEVLDPVPTYMISRDGMSYAISPDGKRDMERVRRNLQGKR